MKAKARKPSWWLPFLIILGMIGALFLEGLDRDLLPLGPGIEMLTIIVGYSLLVFWVYLNRTYLESDNTLQYKMKLIEPRPLATQVPDEPTERFFNAEEQKLQSTPQPFSNS